MGITEGCKFGLDISGVVRQSRVRRPKDMATRYRKVKWNPARIKRLYRGGKLVSEIARAIGYPAGHGQNRVRSLLITAGVYKAAR